MKATDALLADHKMIRKLLSDLRFDNPRFAAILKTLHRAVVGHAWFEDTLLLPALEAEPLLDRRFNGEISQEHKDIDHLLKALKKTPREAGEQLDAYALQLRVLLETHFRKEEDAWFPLAERILGEEGLLNLGGEMKRRQSEIRHLIDG